MVALVRVEMRRTGKGARRQLPAQIFISRKDMLPIKRNKVTDLLTYRTCFGRCTNLKSTQGSSEASDSLFFHASEN
jgi:hypothetical protein